LTITKKEEEGTREERKRRRRKDSQIFEDWYSITNGTSNVAEEQNARVIF